MRNLQTQSSRSRKGVINQNDVMKQECVSCIYESSVYASYTCNEGDPELHAPGERDHQKVQHLNHIRGLPLCYHGVPLQHTYII